MWVVIDTVDAIVRLTHSGAANALTVLSIVGMLLVVAAAVIGIAARVAMGAAWSTSAGGSVAGRLVTTGLFALIRNPVYVAMILLALSVALLIPDVWTVVALIVAAADLELQVRGVEEPHLRAAYGAAYRRYAASTGRFVPLFGRLP